jgi:cysteine synthase
MTRRIGREQGILVGISSGANVVAATKVAKRLVDDDRTGVIVTIFSDSAAKYLSEHFWSEGDGI